MTSVASRLTRYSGRDSGANEEGADSKDDEIARENERAGVVYGAPLAVSRLLLTWRAACLSLRRSDQRTGTRTSSDSLTFPCYLAVL